MWIADLSIFIVYDKGEQPTETIRYTYERQDINMRLYEWDRT